jgi:hypothetical protein
MRFPRIETDFFQVKQAVQESQCSLYGPINKNQLEEKMDDIKCVSYDGTLLWKITNIKEKMSKEEYEY